MKYKNIVVGIILKEKKIYVQKGKKNKYVLDVWEFPGGKVKKNENLIHALKRELLEETGIQILKFRFFQCIEYLCKKIKIFFFLITEWIGLPYSKEGYLYKWVFYKDLNYFSFPIPNYSVIRNLKKNL